MDRDHGSFLGSGRVYFFNRALPIQPPLGAMPVRNQRRSSGIIPTRSRTAAYKSGIAPTTSGGSVPHAATAQTRKSPAAGSFASSDMAQARSLSPAETATTTSVAAAIRVARANHDGRSQTAGVAKAATQAATASRQTPPLNPASASCASAGQPRTVDGGPKSTNANRASGPKAPVAIAQR